MLTGLLFLGCATELPSFPTESRYPSLLEEGYLLGTLLGDDPLLFLVDREGTILWEFPGVEGILNPVISVANDREALLYNEFSEDRALDIGSVNQLRIDGRIEARIRTEGAHHTFTELPDGSVAYLAIDVRDTEEYGPVVGDRVVEIHPDGSATQIFTVWEHFTVIQHQDWESDHYPQGHDWTHGNALFYNIDDNTYLISFRNISTVVEVSRESGQILRQLGGAGSDYKISGAGFQYQHGVHWTDDGTLLMTSSAMAEVGALETRAVEYAVDPREHTLTEIWSYGEGQDLHARALGEAHRLSGGNTLVNWGTAGVLREIAPDGEVLWEMTATGDEFFGRTTFLEDISGLF